MLLLLPPSETKNDSGAGGALRLGELGFPSLTHTRRAVLKAIGELSRDRDASIRALKLGPKQHSEVDRNRVIRRSPTMPAIDLYSGVLYDAFDARTLSSADQVRAHEVVAVHSALFGLVRAGDSIPSYRLSFDSRLPGTTLKRAWGSPITSALERSRGLIVDLRSEGYAGLGPVPSTLDSIYVRVLARDDSGRVRALNHFNKQAKGLFARAIVASGAEFHDASELVDWAVGEGYEVALNGREFELVVPSVTGQPGRLMATLR
ncbi:YaaA family protein [Diaminobutyricibacter sp. McL0608]|uniref:YaaA family protein n=1 Tax=Leifsonia sp. McL0608 TaxID=3143537 RepID=UPI0031F2E184